MAQGKNLVQILWDAGFRGKGLRTAYGIVMRESGGRADAYNPNRSTGDDSYGLFQINMLGNMGASRRKQFGLRSNEDLFDPLTNAKAAFRMSNGGKDWGAWGIGPNAYRSGAGYDTIKQYVDQFPGAPGGGWGKAPRTSAAQKAAAPDLQTSVPQLTSESKDYLQKLRKRRGILADVMQRNSQLLGLTPPKPLIERLLTLTDEDEERIKRQMAGTGKLAADDPSASTPMKATGKMVSVPRAWKGTHVTDGLGWGTKTAIDIMGKPGTRVSSPAAGVVVYFHPTGAQGGGSMLIRGTDGKEYWIGHIDKGLKSGTAIRFGQPIGVISADHAAPHVHLDWRWM